MTAEEALERWAVMLTPLFPVNADVERYTENTCCLIDADWGLDAHGTRSRLFRISVTSDAMRDYLVAGEDTQHLRDDLLSDAIAQFVATRDARHDREPWNRPVDEIVIRTEFLNACDESRGGKLITVSQDQVS